MMSRSTFAQFTLVLGVGFSALGARAEGSLSAQNWSEQFAAALKSGNLKEAQQLIDFGKLDKSILTVCNDCADKENLELARQLFAKGDYAAARNAYNKISKASPYWLQAVEEKAWTHFRENDLTASLAQTKTLLAPHFASYVGSEPYFLQALAQLKSCNYKEVFETNRLFKEKQKPRLAEIQELSKTGLNDALKNVMATAETFPIKFSDIGENAPHLPHLFFKDLEFQRQLLRFKLSEKALAALQSHGGSNKLQDTLGKTKSTSERQLQNRMKELAIQETNANFKIVQKLNLVEVETIQRLHNDIELDKSLFKRGDFKKTDVDQLVFVDDGRPWIDELDKYEVRMKSCPQNIRRKM